MSYLCDRHVKSGKGNMPAKYLVANPNGRGTEAVCHIHIQPALNAFANSDEVVEVQVTVLPKD